jgi:hypothetical protein
MLDIDLTSLCKPLICTWDRDQVLDRRWRLGSSGETSTVGFICDDSSVDSAKMGKCGCREWDHNLWSKYLTSEKESVHGCGCDLDTVGGPDHFGEVFLVIVCLVVVVLR